MSEHDTNEVAKDEAIDVFTALTLAPATLLMNVLILEGSIDLTNRNHQVITGVLLTNKGQKHG